MLLLKRILFSLLACFYVVSAISGTEDSLALKKADKTYQVTRSFKSLKSPVIPKPSKGLYTENYLLPVSDEENDIRKKIETTYERIFTENRFIDFLDEASLLDLPVGIKADIGILKYIILIDSVVMTPKESLLYASMVFETPQGKRIHFLGSDIKFSKSGGISGDAKLLLVGDYPINLDGDKSQLIIKGSNKKTFVEFDCKGYKQLSLDASLLFSRDLIIPVDSSGITTEQKNVSIDFTTTIVDWNDILVNVNVPTFSVNGINGVTISIQDAVLDFSDTRNPASIRFPQGYEQMSPLIIDGNLNLWNGVFIRDLTVTLPPQFKNENKEGTANSVSFKGNNLVIDNVGFSGILSANNLIPIDKGKIGNWDFSLETFYIDVVANELKEAGFKGKINIPINAKQSTQEQAPKDSTSTNENYFLYNAIIKKGNDYTFTVQNARALKFDLWKANVTLHPSSFIEVRLNNDSFLPKAYLNGEMTMNIGLNNGEASADNNKNVKIPKLLFQGLEIQTIKPYVKVGAFSLGTEKESPFMGGFPIAINEIFGSSKDDKIELGIDITLSLIKEADGGFGANGRFRIIGQSIEEEGKKLTYKFKSIEVDRFGIDIDKGTFKFKGTLNFYKEDVVYGNGISGVVDATFAPSFRLQASAIFGNKNGNRYWFADALATFKSGVTIFPGFAFYSFGGGAYYKMKIGSSAVGSALGKTVSGMVYVPDETVGFGLKATVSLGVQPGEKAFNADATYEMAFNQGGGVKYINFRGNGYFLTSPLTVDNSALLRRATKLATVCEKSPGQELNTQPQLSAEMYGSATEAGSRAQVWASLVINYDFDSRVLHGNMQTYVNVANGLIKGAGANGQAGEAVIHFAPGEWYIYIGRPEYENRFAIEVLGLARMDAYFVMGTNIPSSPPPPSNVSSILGGVDLDYMKDLNALGEGAGVGFGASFSVDTGDLTFLMFYGRFTAGMGFDIMLKNYNASCEGRGKLGINGWYANGQAYAYLEGKIGIKVKILRKKKKVNILNIGAAVVAQAKLPNPVWVKGTAGGYFNVLGGLVKGNCKFEIVIGEECKMIQDQGGSVLESIDVLAQATPANNTEEVDVFTLPQAVFNYEIEKEYEMVDDYDQVIKFKISLDEFSIKDGTTSLQAETKWNSDRTVAALNPFEILPPQKELTLDIVLSFKEQKGGYW